MDARIYFGSFLFYNNLDEQKGEFKRLFKAGVGIDLGLSTKDREMAEGHSHHAIRSQSNELA
jgi:hypothetical protein